MEKIETKGLTLKVAEALVKDVGRAMARLGPQDMTRIGYLNLIKKKVCASD